MNDYEGISGHERYRDDLVLMYFLTVGVNGLVRLRMAPLRIVRFRLERASAGDASWLRETLTRESAAFGTRIQLTEDVGLEARWD